MEAGGLRHIQAALHPGKSPRSHCTGGWMGPRTGLDGRVKYRTHQIIPPSPRIPSLLLCLYCFRACFFVFIVLPCAFCFYFTTPNTNIHAPGGYRAPSPKK